MAKRKPVRRSHKGALGLAPAKAGLLGFAKGGVIPGVFMPAVEKGVRQALADGVTAGWVTKSMQVKAAGQIGSMAGNYAGQKAMEQVPFVGGFLGKKAGAAVGRGVALKAIGGEEFLRSSTDLSFNSLNDMALFMYVNYSTNPEYQKILDATYAIYPDFQTAYLPALQSASVGK